MPSAPRYVFETVDRSIDPVSVRRGQNPPAVMNRGGGWEVVSRARRKGVTQWVGAEPARMSVPVLFDGWKDTDSQEEEISRLARMALPPGPNKEPPKVRVRNGVPLVGLVWVIQGIDWGTVQLWGYDNNGSVSRMRQDAVVTLMEYVPPETIKVDSRPATQTQNATNNRMLYSVKDGESLSSIAVKLYGDRERWKDLADANSLRDPNSIRVNDLLRVPA